MRNYACFESSIVLEEVENISRSVLAGWEAFTSRVLDDPKFLDTHELDFYLPRNLRALQFITIFSYYTGEIGFVLRESIRDFVHDSSSNYKLDDLIVIEILLESKTHCELFLLDTHLWNTYEFFGQFSKRRLSSIMNSVVRWKKKVKAVEVQRKRGHQDYSRPAVPRTAYRDSRFVDLTFEHYEEELNRQIFSDSKSLIQGLLE